MENKDFNDKICRIIDILSDNSDMIISNINKGSKLYHNYKLLKNKIKKYQNTDRFDLIIDIIKKQYRPTYIKPNTIGSFLYGCFQNFYGDISKECSILCIGNINDSTDCLYQVYSLDVEKKEDRLKQISRTESNRAIIYINKKTFQLMENEVSYLKQNGIEYVKILITKKSKHYTLYKMTNIDSIPIYNTNISHDSKSKSNINLINIKTNKTNTKLYIIIFIIIIIIIIMLYIFC